MLLLVQMLSRKIHYLHVALNSSLEEAGQIISRLPPSERILIEAGTPLLKREGIFAISHIRNMWQSRLALLNTEAYVVADLKTMDRGSTEVQMAKDAGASAVTALGQAPVETINSFIDTCQRLDIDSMLDLMNTEQPIKVLRKLKRMPTVVILHRGVDEEDFNKDKPIPYIQINKIRSSYDVLIAVGGGDTIREVQRAIFNNANIVMVWREFYRPSDNTASLAEEFLKVIR